MKLRKSLVKPVMWQNISSCLVLPPEIVMHDAFYVILWTSADICRHAWRSQVEEPKNSIQLQAFCRVTGFRSDFRPPKTSRRYMCRAWQSRVEEPNNTL